MSLGSTSLSCKLCGLSEFRASRLRRKDFLRLLFLRLPIRCHACHERTFAPLMAVLRLSRSGHRLAHPARS